MREVFCLDDGAVYTFDCNTAYEALDKMKYTLNSKAMIDKVESGQVLHFIHEGKTYTSLNY